LPELIVAGAGMAGLCAAAEARARGAEVVVLEKGDRAGGSMLWSSGVVWRHRSWEDFRAECPDGDPVLQRAVWEELDAGLDWLESLGAPVTERSTGNPRTSGRRFDTSGLTAALVRAAGDVRLETALDEPPAETPVILATGGFAADRDLTRRHITPWADDLVLRSNPWSAGDGLRVGLAAGARTGLGMEQFYGRAMPAPPARIEPGRFVGSAQLYARHASISDLAGDTYVARTWSEIDVVQWMARRPRARARYRVAEDALGERVRDRTVADMIAAAERAGAPVDHRPGAVTVEVVAGITTTLGGLAGDADGRVAPGVWAAGADLGGISTGGYASGLAAALVMGRRAAAAALGHQRVARRTTARGAEAPPMRP
jgi:succinate dehydrogenase/fumarate reductase flavoprotein subunit